MERAQPAMRRTACLRSDTRASLSLDSELALLDPPPASPHMRARPTMHIGAPRTHEDVHCEHARLHACPADTGGLR